jgi:hypothetical protein
MRPVSSLSDLAIKAKTNSQYQELAIKALSALGCEHLACGRGEPWQNAIAGLKAYWRYLVGEHGMPEDQAEADLIEEINFVRVCFGRDK